MRATGVASIANDTLVLRGDSMLNSTALYFQGDGLANGTFGLPFDGLELPRLAPEEVFAPEP